MTADPTPVLAAAALVGLVVSGHLSVTTIVRRSDPSALAWSSGCLAASGAAVIGCVSTVVGSGNVVVWAAVAGLVCYAPGSLWSGVRHFDDVPGSVLPQVAAGAVAAAAAVLWLPVDLGIAVAATIAAGFSAACGHALAVRSAGSNLDTRIASVACGAHALLSLLAGAAALVGDSPAPLVAAWWVLALTGLLAPATALSFYGMQALRSAASREEHRDDTALSVLDRRTFVAVARDRLERVAGLPDADLGLVVTTVADLEEIRVVYGSDAARRAVALVADVLRSTVPPASDVGHLGGAAFGVLSVAQSGRPSSTVEEAITRGLFEQAASPRLPVRVACTFESADAGEVAALLERSLGSASTRLSRS